MRPFRSYLLKIYNTEMCRGGNTRKCSVCIGQPLVTISDKDLQNRGSDRAHLGACLLKSKYSFAASAREAIRIPGFPAAVDSVVA